MLPIIGALIALIATLILVNRMSRSSTTVDSLQQELRDSEADVSLDMQCLSDATSVPAIDDLERNMEAINKRLQHLRRSKHEKGFKRY